MPRHVRRHRSFRRPLQFCLLVLALSLVPAGVVHFDCPGPDSAIPCGSNLQCKLWVRTVFGARR